MVAPTTFPDGISLTARLSNLQARGVLTTSIDDPDTLTCKVISVSGVDQDITGPVSGDGSGNYSCTFISPTRSGNYYLLWESYISGDYGKHIFEFQVRKP